MSPRVSGRANDEIISAKLGDAVCGVMVVAAASLQAEPAVARSIILNHNGIVLYKIIKVKYVLNVSYSVKLNEKKKIVFFDFYCYYCYYFLPI